MHAVPGRSDDLVGTGVGGVFVLVRLVLFSDVESTWCSGVGDCWLATVCQGYCLSGLPETVPLLLGTSTCCQRDHHC